MKPLFFNVIKGLAVFGLCAVALLLLFSFIALKTEDPQSYAFAFGNAALILSAFIGGRFSVTPTVSRLLSGVVSGLVSMTVILLISLITSSLGSGSFLKMALTVLLFVLGALSKRGEVKHFSSAKKRKSIAKKYSVAR